MFAELLSFWQSSESGALLKGMRFRGSGGDRAFVSRQRPDLKGPFGLWKYWSVLDLMACLVAALLADGFE